MGKNSIKTSAPIASKAAKLLKKAKESTIKEVAGSDLVNRKHNTKQTKK